MHPGYAGIDGTVAGIAVIIVCDVIAAAALTVECVVYSPDRLRCGNHGGWTSCQCCWWAGIVDGANVVLTVVAGIEASIAYRH